MAKAAFGIIFLPEDGKLHANGNDDVEFMLSANKENRLSLFQRWLPAANFHA